MDTGDGPRFLPQGSTCPTPKAVHSVEDEDRGGPVFGQWHINGCAPLLERTAKQALTLPATHLPLLTATNASCSCKTK